MGKCPGMRPLLFKVILVFLWTFPLSAQEMVETCAGVVERRTFVNGAAAVLQPLPDSPVAAVTLAFPWGRGDGPATCDLLNQILSRTSSNYPAGSLLLRLEEMGALNRFQTGQSWSSWTLVVPRGYANWALEVQLDRLAGPWLKNDDSSGLLKALGAPAGVDFTSLQSLFLQHWNPGQAVVAVTGGFNPQEITRTLSRVSSLRAGEASLVQRQRIYLPHRLAWNFPRPKSPQQRAAAHLWQAALEQESQGVQLDLDPAEQGYWLSTSLSSNSDVEQASPILAASLPGHGLKMTPRIRQKAVQSWLADWDDLGSRARLLAIEQGRGELGSSLPTFEALCSYPLDRWNQDLAAFDAPANRFEALPLMPAPQTARTPAEENGKIRSKPGPPLPHASVAASPPFVRLEYAPGCGAVIQTVADLPVVAVRAVLPGGSACDTAAMAGRAEWLGAYWQSVMDRDFPTRVETQTYGWQFSAYLPRDQVTPWLTRFFHLWSESQVDLTVARQVKPHSAGVTNPVQTGYRDWLELLFPPDHPLGRHGEAATLSPERVQELQAQIRQQGRWNLFLSGDVTGPEVELALHQAAPPAPGGAPSSGWDSLPTQPQLPTEAVVKPSDTRRCTLLVGGYGPARRDADYYAFVLLLQTLAGDPLRSRLQIELRYKNSLADRVDVSFLSSAGVSPWLLRIDCAPENLATVQARLKQQLDELQQHEIRSDELALAVSRLEGQQQVADVNSTGRVQQLRNLELFRLSDSYNQGFAGIYRQITSKDVLASAKLRLLPQRLATLIVTPKS